MSSGSSCAGGYGHCPARELEEGGRPRKPAMLDFMAVVRVRTTTAIVHYDEGCMSGAFWISNSLLDHPQGSAAYGKQTSKMESSCSSVTRGGPCAYEWRATMTAPGAPLPVHVMNPSIKNPLQIAMHLATKLDSESTCPPFLHSSLSKRTPAKLVD